MSTQSRNAQISECDAISRPPILDMTGKVKKIDRFYIKNGEFSDLYAGQLLEDTKSHQHGEKVAIKVLRGAPAHNHELHNETEKKLNEHGLQWRQLEHKNVLDFLGIVYDMGYLPALITPFCEHGNIVEFMIESKSDMSNTLLLILGISKGLQYLHSNNIIHGDLRAANVLIDNDLNPVIADFGLTFVIDHGEFTTNKIAGPARWTAPEILDPPGEDESEPPYSEASDVFAFGMTMIEIFTCKLPYSNIRNDSAVIFRIIKGERPVMPENIERIEYLKALINSTWKGNPKERPSALQVKQTLELNITADKSLGLFSPFRFAMFYIRRFFGDYDTGGAVWCVAFHL